MTAEEAISDALVLLRMSRDRLKGVLPDLSPEARRVQRRALAKVRAAITSVQNASQA